MNMTQVRVFLVCTFSVVACSLAADKPSGGAMRQQKAVASLKSPEQKQALEKNVITAEDAQREMEAFQAKVVKGDIPIVNNNGVWCAVLDESKTVTKLANYASQDGPMTCFMKMVYSDAAHKSRVNELGYRLNVSTNGMVKGYMRADMQEMVEYHQNGQIKTFSHKMSNGWYTAKWAEKDSQLLNESSSVGTLIDKKTDKDR